jgi:hypothetical protein
MKQQKIIDHPNLIKKDNSFIVNINKNEYEGALRRRKLQEEKKSLEVRLAILEKQVAALISNLSPIGIR